MSRSLRTVLPCLGCIEINCISGNIIFSDIGQLSEFTAHSRDKLRTYMYVSGLTCVTSGNEMVIASCGTIDLWSGPHPINAARL